VAHQKAEYSPHCPQKKSTAEEALLPPETISRLSGITYGAIRKFIEPFLIDYVLNSGLIYSIAFVLTFQDH